MPGNIDVLILPVLYFRFSTFYLVGERELLINGNVLAFGPVGEGVFPGLSLG